VTHPCLYRSRGRWMFWIAFVCAVGIHIGAVVIAKTKSESGKVENFTPLDGDVELMDTEPDPRLPDDSVTSPPLEQIHPDRESFSEENLKEPKVRPRKRVRSASSVGEATVPLRSVKAMAMYAPRPVYPYEARRLRITGSGTALLTVDPALGNVTDVLMVQSCGNAILDNATLDALRRWRFKPGSVVRVQVPITYTLLMGVSY
jgi:TonB family protein